MNYQNKEYTKRKSMGADGFPIDFYKKFREKLLVPPLAMYEESYVKGALITNPEGRQTSECSLFPKST